MFLIFSVLAINIGLLSVNTILWSTYHPGWMGTIAAVGAIMNLLSTLAVLYFAIATLAGS